MKLRAIRMAIVVALFGALALILGATVLRSAPILDSYPPKAGDVLQVSVVCDFKGATALLAAFIQDASRDEINRVYQEQLELGLCVVPGVNFPATILSVEEPIPLLGGDVVYPLVLALENNMAPVFTFIIATKKALGTAT